MSSPACGKYVSCASFYLLVKGTGKVSDRRTREGSIQAPKKQSALSVPHLKAALSWYTRTLLQHVPMHVSHICLILPAMPFPSLESFLLPADPLYFNDPEAIANTEPSVLVLYNIDTLELIGGWEAVSNNGTVIEWARMPDQVSIPLESYEAVLSSIMELPPPIPVKLVGGQAAALLQLLGIGMELEECQAGPEVNVCEIEVGTHTVEDEHTEVGCGETASPDAELGIPTDAEPHTSATRAATATNENTGRPDIVRSSLQPAAVPFTPAAIAVPVSSKVAAAAAPSATSVARSVPSRHTPSDNATAASLSTPATAIRALSSRSNSFNIGATGHIVVAPVMDIAQNLSPRGFQRSDGGVPGPRAPPGSPPIDTAAVRSIPGPRVPPGEPVVRVCVSVTMALLDV